MSRRPTSATYSSRGPSTLSRWVTTSCHSRMNFSETRARSARIKGEVEGEMLNLPPLTSENETKCSGGETRTLNLAVNSRLLCH
jgi:hypothetical protein